MKDLSGILAAILVLPLVFLLGGAALSVIGAVLPGPLWLRCVDAIAALAMLCFSVRYCVWIWRATGEEKMKKLPVLLFNTTIVTAPGSYTMEPISTEKARALVAVGVESAIGHDASARAMSVLLGIDVPVNRVPAVQASGQVAVCLKIRGRLPEGVILDDEKLREIGFDLFLLTRTT